ncbi:MAG: hypothetical protein ABSF55_00935 [Candidatus Staskawiczbacteria bacterium]
MKILQEVFIKHRSLFLILCVGVALVLIHIPFYMTGNIQDDAYIYFRCGQNLADSGVYGFNNGEKVSACTSHLYVFMIAAVRLVFGNFFIPAIMFVNFVIFLCGLYILSSLFFSDLKRRLLVWGISSLMPISLVISNRGMETPLLILLIVIVFKWIYTQKADFFTYSALFLIPFVRPDWAVFILMPILFVFVKNKKFDYKIFFISMFGILAFFLFNKLYFGSFLNQTIIAKSIMVGNFSLARFFAALKQVFVGDYSLFIPFSGKYFIPLIPVSFIVFIYFAIKNFQKASSALKNVLIAMLIIIFLIPLLYSFGQLIFPWYLFPSSFFIFFLIVSGFIIFLGQLNGRKLFNIAVLVGIVILSFSLIVQWLVDFNGFLRDNCYRASIGRYIKSISTSNDSIMTGDIGYIPFFSERYTHDIDGLASPLVTDYEKKYGSRWIMPYLKDQKPTFIVEHNYDIFQTLALYYGYVMSQKEKEWFQNNYRVVKEFYYDPADFCSNRIIVALFKKLAGDYVIIYKKN